MKKIGSMFVIVFFLGFLNVDVSYINVEDYAKFELSINLGVEIKRDK